MADGAETLMASLSLIDDDDVAAAAAGGDEDDVTVNSVTSQTCTSSASSHMSSLLSQPLSAVNVTDTLSSVPSGTLIGCDLSVTSSQMSAMHETTSPQRNVSPELSDNAVSHSSTDSVPITHQSLSSINSPPLMDFISIEIPRREYPAELRERQYDAVVISTREDEHIADVFKHILTEFITLEVCVAMMSLHC